jgi:hypothetical protein
MHEMLRSALQPSYLQASLMPSLGKPPDGNADLHSICASAASDAAMFGTVSIRVVPRAPPALLLAAANVLNAANRHII